MTEKWTTESEPHPGSSNKCRQLCGLCIAVIDIGISNTFIHSFSAQDWFTSCSQQGLLPVQGNTIHMEDEKPRKESNCKLKVLDSTSRWVERKMSMPESPVKIKEGINSNVLYHKNVSTMSNLQPLGSIHEPSYPSLDHSNREAQMWGIMFLPKVAYLPANLFLHTGLDLAMLSF